MQEEITRTVTEETGKPVTEVINQEITATLGMLKFFEKAYPRWLQTHQFRYWRPGFWTKLNTVHFEPLGPIAIIGPSTFPFSLPVMQACAVLLCGNSVIIKPSELCPKTAGLIRHIFKQSLLPEGVVEIVEGAGEVVEALIAHEAVKKVIFTGSHQTGKQVAELCGQHFKPCILELGGSGAAIICDDANLLLAAKGIAWSAFYVNGLSCVGTKRVFVQTGVAERFIQNLWEEIETIKTGDPFDPITEVGNINNEKTINRVKELANDAVSKGARMWTSDGGFSGPVILLNVSPSMRVMQEEVSAPLLAIRDVDSVEQAIQEANDTTFGLSASVWSKDSKNAKAIARQLSVGMVWINDASAGQPQFPWGGLKQSGWGRLFSREAVYELTNLKVISHDKRRTSLRKIWWFPYSRTKYETFLSVNELFFGRIKIKSMRLLAKVIRGRWRHEH